MIITEGPVCESPYTCHMPETDLVKEASLLEAAAKRAKSGANQLAKQQRAIDTKLQVQIQKLRDLAERAKRS